jgi:hypothetical protein
VEQLLNSAFLTPYSIISLEKFNGRSVEIGGEKKYEMRFFATLSYSADKLSCRRDLCPELHNYLLEVDPVKKVQTSRAGSFLSGRTEYGAKAKIRDATTGGAVDIADHASCYE